MAQTPEGKVKAKGRSICKELGIFYFPAQMTGFGRNGIPDDILCVKGQFISIEYKADSKKKPTPLQIKAMSDIRKAGGITLLVHADNIRCMHPNLTYYLRHMISGYDLQKSFIGFTEEIE